MSERWRDETKRAICIIGMSSCTLYRLHVSHMFGQWSPAAQYGCIVIYGWIFNSWLTMWRKLYFAKRIYSLWCEWERRCHVFCVCGDNAIVFGGANSKQQKLIEQSIHSNFICFHLNVIWLRLLRCEHVIWFPEHTNRIENITVRLRKKQSEWNESKE